MIVHMSRDRIAIVDLRRDGRRRHRLAFGAGEPGALDGVAVPAEPPARLSRPTWLRPPQFIESPCGAREILPDQCLANGEATTLALPDSDVRPRRARDCRLAAPTGLVVAGRKRRKVDVKQGQGTPLTDRLATVAFHGWFRWAGKSLPSLDQLDHRP